MDDDVKFDYKFKLIDYKPYSPSNFVEAYYGPTLSKYLVGWNPEAQYSSASIEIDKNKLALDLLNPSTSVS
jgi:hypothetical protein